MMPGQGGLRTGSRRGSEVQCEHLFHGGSTSLHLLVPKIALGLSVGQMGGPYLEEGCPSMILLRNAGLKGVPGLPCTPPEGQVLQVVCLFPVTGLAAPPDPMTRRIPNTNPR